MLQRCKIVSVKTVLDNEGVVYVQAMIKKSYGTEVRPAVLLFNGVNPEKGYCSWLKRFTLSYPCFVTVFEALQQILKIRFWLYLVQNSYKSGTANLKKDLF